MRIPRINEKKRNQIIRKLGEYGVATNVHYKPLPMMTAYMTMGWNIVDFENSYNYYRNLISLPLHTMLSDEDVDYVCDVLETVINEEFPVTAHIIWEEQLILQDQVDTILTRT